MERVNITGTRIDHDELPLTQPSCRTISTTRVSDRFDTLVNKMAMSRQSRVTNNELPIKVDEFEVTTRQESFDHKLVDGNFQVEVDLMKLLSIDLLH